MASTSAGRKWGPRCASWEKERTKAAAPPWIITSYSLSLFVLSYTSFSLFLSCPLLLRFSPSFSLCSLPSLLFFLTLTHTLSLSHFLSLYMYNWLPPSYRPLSIVNCVYCVPSSPFSPSLSPFQWLVNNIYFVFLSLHLPLTLLIFIHSSTFFFSTSFLFLPLSSSATHHRCRPTPENPFLNPLSLPSPLTLEHASLLLAFLIHFLPPTLTPSL